MTEEFRKEAYRLFWLVKGHLGCHNWTDKSNEEMHDSYFKRMWCKYQGDDMSKVEDGLLTSSRTAGFDNMALTLYEVSASFSSASLN